MHDNHNSTSTAVLPMNHDAFRSNPTAKKPQATMSVPSTVSSLLRHDDQDRMIAGRN